jgi:hypothetical protein
LGDEYIIRKGLVQGPSSATVQLVYKWSPYGLHMVALAIAEAVALACQVAFIFSLTRAHPTTSVSIRDNVSASAAAIAQASRTPTMLEADIVKLSAIPWVAKLLNDKRWTPTRSSNRLAKPTGEDSFFAETLDTGRTIRTMLTLRPSKEEEGDQAYKELLVILELGDGLNGYPQVLHGGFAATLLDEACGGLIQLNVFEKRKKLGSQHAMNYLTACRCCRRPEL